jgi:antitoxin VapB
MPFKEIDLKDQADVQLIEIPDTFKIKDNKAYLKKVGNSIYVIPYHNPWESLVDSIGKFTADYMKDREQPAQQKREFIDS